MPHTISVNSFRRGTGKSNLTANLGALLAASGQNVAIVDMDLPSPSQQTLFGLTDSDIQFTLNDFLWGNCEIEQAALDLTSRLSLTLGTLHLVPASQRLNEIARVLRGDYYLDLLHDAFDQLAESLKLDTLLIDTHAGLSEETLMVFGLSDAAVILLRSDSLDYEGTAVTVDVARQLEVERIGLVVNELPTQIPSTTALQQVALNYNCEVFSVLHHTPQLAALASGGIFGLRYPTHPLTKSFRQIAAQLTA